LSKFVENNISIKGAKMSIKDIEKMKKYLAEKKAKEQLSQKDNKIGNGAVEKRHKNIGIDSERTNKISQ